MASQPPPDLSEPSSGTLARAWVDLRVAAAFLTRVPVPLPADDGGETGALARSAGMFPVVGVGVGVSAAIVMLLADRLGLHPLACALIALGAQMVITGALHEDGLADMADGIGGGQDAAERLAIMRDSRIGTYGALALILTVALKATLLSQLPSIETAAAALIGAAAISRGTLPAVMRWITPARPDGLFASIGQPPVSAVRAALVLSLIIALIAYGLGLGIVVCAVAAGGAAGVAVVAQRTLGGITGDALGAAQQKAELLVLVAVAASP
jgi:adenosylcobinamide-GDP ribazoletransferase